MGSVGLATGARRTFGGRRATIDLTTRLVRLIRSRRLRGETVERAFCANRTLRAFATGFVRFFEGAAGSTEGFLEAGRRKVSRNMSTYRAQIRARVCGDVRRCGI